jgi:predicted Rossmann fold flavoprotein
MTYRGDMSEDSKGNRKNKATTDKRERKTATTVWDVVVIGGGAAGMMAAGTAANELSKLFGNSEDPDFQGPTFKPEGRTFGNRSPRVLLLEKNPTLGKKLLITGGGRCNVTNAEENLRTFLAKFAGKDRKDDQFLFSAFSKWSIKDTLDFFHAHGMETKVEAEKRVFPVSNSAKSVWNVLVHFMDEGSVQVRTKQSITKCIRSNSEITSVVLATGEEIKAKAFILATGGKSRPETGSTGDGFTWLKEFGHSVSESNAALVPITLKDTWTKELSGISFNDIQLTVFQSNKKQLRKKGKLLFTHKGITGPTVLNMSRDIGELLKYGSVTIEIDLVPEMAPDVLHTRLQELLATQSNKKVKNVLGEIVPSAMVTPLLHMTEIDEQTFSHSLTREKRIALLQKIKAIPLQVKGLQGIEKAVVTSGGVALDEIDFKTMQSKRISNLFIVGDLLNLDRPSGGYSLQICWTTGVVAGTSAAILSAAQDSSA